MKVTQSCPVLRDPMVCSPPGSSACGLLQTRILAWVAISFSRGSSQPRDRTQDSCTAGRFSTIRVTRSHGPGDWRSQVKVVRSCGLHSLWGRSLAASPSFWQPHMFLGSGDKTPISLHLHTVASSQRVSGSTRLLFSSNPARSHIGLELTLTTSL